MVKRDDPMPHRDKENEKIICSFLKKALSLRQINTKKKRPL